MFINNCCVLAIENYLYKHCSDPMYNTESVYNCCLARADISLT